MSPAVRGGVAQAGMTRVARGAVVAVCAFTLSACGGLPLVSPITRGLEVGAPRYSAPKIKYNAPAPGASPEDIVRGFLTVSWGPNEAAVDAAKTYLTPEAAASWTPDAGVTVYQQSSTLKVSRTGSQVSVSGPLVARLDEQGRYQQAAVGEQTHVSLSLRQVDGEWRISRLPADFGVWLSWSNFSSNYTPMPVHYVDRFERLLVPDLRWVPLGQGQLAALARSQIGTMPAYLQGAAVSGVPAGTELAVESVPVQDGVAQVELTRAPATAELRRMVWAQMFATMTQMQGVRSVLVTVDGVPMTFPGLPDPVTSLESLGYSAPRPAPSAVVLRRGEVLEAADFTGWLSGGQAQRPVEATLPRVSKAWDRIAVSEDLTQVAGVDAAGRHLYRWTPKGSGGPQPWASRLTAPAFDRRGRTWVAGVDAATGRAEIWWWPADTGPTASPRRLEQSWIGRDRRITMVKPSPGGRRLAVVVQDAAGVASVYVAGISVAQDREPVELRTPYRVAAGLTQVADLAWVDDENLGVIAAAGDRVAAPTLLPIGAQPRVLPPVRGAERIMTSGGARGVIVVSSGGGVWRRAGGGWHEQDRLDDMVIPGS